MADKAKELSEKIDALGLEQSREDFIDCTASLIREAIRPLVEAADEMRAYVVANGYHTTGCPCFRLREELKGWSLQISDGANEKRK